MDPAGESPVPVSAEAPGSRPQATGEIPRVPSGASKARQAARAAHGEQARGPQHEVKPAASTEKQSESRAAHVTAKATSDGATIRTRATDLGGVGGAARVQGAARNTRDPSAQPSSRQGGSYKPKAKSSAAQRESEGIVVPDDGRRQKTRSEGRGPAVVVLMEEVSARAWPARRSQPPRGRNPWKSATTPRAAVGRGQAATGSTVPRAVRPDLQE